MPKSSISFPLLCLFVLVISSFNFGEWGQMGGLVCCKSANNISGAITVDDRVPYNDLKVWCMAKPSASDRELLNNIDYVCGQVGLDCSRIQAGGQCFYPNDPINHASVVMNIYFQHFGRNFHNCDFSNSALISISDPSYGTCLYSYV